LRDLQRRLGITTIFVTHDQEEANTICDRIAVMNEGVIQQVGTPMELYERPANLFVAGFLGSANMLEGTASADGRVFETAGGARISVPTGRSLAPGAKLVFRPQDAILADPDAPQSGTELRGTVSHREFLGAMVRYAIRVGRDEIAVDAPFHAGAALLAIGAPAAVSLPAHATLFLAR
jgi:iron(III) transport system ATP-binding protein